MKFIVLLLPFLFWQTVLAEELQYGISAFGKPKYQANFKHFDYVNKNASKGGKISIGKVGTFNTLNSFTVKGTPAFGLSLTFETLLERAKDEPYSAYGLLAESVMIDDEGKWAVFKLRKAARWNDGIPITADDIIFSFYTLIQKGHPFYRSYYRGVEKVEKLDKYRVKFIFSDQKNRLLPIIVGEMPILSKHYYTIYDFNSTTLEPPVTSSPYIIKEVKVGHSVSYQRNQDYWGKDLPINKGRYNFDTIEYKYYRNDIAAIEALKVGEYDLRQENSIKLWATADYNRENEQGIRLVKEAIPQKISSGMKGFVFNTRKKEFQNQKVRKALSGIFDFNWVNKVLFYDLMEYDQSYFPNTDYAFYAHNKVNKSRRHRILETRKILLNEGLYFKDKKLHFPNHLPFKIEFLLPSNEYKPVVAFLSQDFKKLGIETSIRIADISSYIERIQNFDFDITLYSFPISAVPNNELADYWHSSSANIKGSNNIAGVQNPDIDKLIEKVLNIEDKEKFIRNMQSLDKELQKGAYVIPLGYDENMRLIYWNKFSKPAIVPSYGLGVLDTWWCPDY